MVATATNCLKRVFSLFNQLFEKWCSHLRAWKFNRILLRESIHYMSIEQINISNLFYSKTWNNEWYEAPYVRTGGDGVWKKIDQWGCYLFWKDFGKSILSEATDFCSFLLVSGEHDVTKRNASIRFWAWNLLLRET